MSPAPVNQEKLQRIQEIRARLEIDLLELFMAYRYLPGEPTEGGIDAVGEMVREAVRRAREA